MGGCQSKKLKLIRHDLKNNLSAIRGTIEVFEKRYPDDDFHPLLKEEIADMLKNINKL